MKFNMKLIIVEGLDNTGKTTVINYLLTQFNSCFYFHCQKPINTDPIKSALEQKDLFYSLLNDILDINTRFKNIDAIILDRSWIGEYVYGCKYRGNGDEFVMDMIIYINDKLSVNNIHTFNILLTVDNIDFIMNNDDGKSISNNKYENILNEKERFEYIFDEIPKLNEKNIYTKKIVVNDNLKFKNKNDIFSEINKFIKYHK